MTVFSDLKWRDGKKPGPQSANAGSTWKFTLPVSGSTADVRCVWKSDLFDRYFPDLETSGLTVDLKLPDDIPCDIYKIGYSVEGVLEGEFKFKITPGTAGAGDSVKNEPLSGGSSMQNQASASTSTVNPVKPHPPRRKDVNVSPQQKSVTDESKWPPGGYRIIVRNPAASSSQFEIPVEKHKSLLIGKRSLSQGIFPDIDLKPYFSSSDDAGRCSRRQASVFCIDNNIFCKNIGKGSLETSDGKTIKPGESHEWLPGQRLIVPGGLIVTLETAQIY